MSLAAYRAFVDEYAPYAYARLFAKLGDFQDAQDSLRRALDRGYARWQRNGAGAIETVDALISRIGPRLVDVAARDASTSFAKSRKLQAIADAVGILREFDERDRAILVLLHVEEVPAERISRWTGVDAAAYQGIRDRLLERLRDWNPPTAADEDGKTFFFRALRNYRLPAGFAQSISPVEERPSFQISTPIWIILVICGVVFVLSTIGKRWDRYELLEREEEVLLLSLTVGHPWVTLLWTIVPALLWRFFRCHASQGLRATFRYGLPWISGAAISGFGFLVLDFVFAVKPRALFRDREFAVTYIFGHSVWMMWACVVTMLALYSVLVWKVKGESK